MKVMTGEKNILLRYCHSRTNIEFRSNFITLVMCNCIPMCDDMDVAFSNKLICITFPTEFVNNPGKPYQKKSLYRPYP